MAGPFLASDRAAIARFAAALPRAQLHFPDDGARGCDHAVLRTGGRELKITRRGSLFVLIDLRSGTVLATGSDPGTLLAAA